MAHSRTQPRRVDFYFEAQDFQVVMLGSLGFSNLAICDITGLTVGQVMYRLMKTERGKRTGERSSRMKYRNGDGDIAKAVLTTVAAKNGIVSKSVVKHLDRKGLYTPR